jgi:hypothetical protein
MAIQDKEREAIIAKVLEYEPAIVDLCAVAFDLGHEEGWWLARTDPDSTISPVGHAAQVNPFIRKVDEKPTKWDVMYRDEVTEYPDEAEARKQWNFACMDVPANLVKWVDSKWVIVLDNGNFYPQA